jgi:hypothetical protein|uniref:Uncharacterized protein n=1 Tax=Zea mays TaxID=4577 RepID=A0A804P9B3_MAIZE
MGGRSEEKGSGTARSRAGPCPGGDGEEVLGVGRKFVRERACLPAFFLVSALIFQRRDVRRWKTPSRSVWVWLVLATSEKFAIMEVLRCGFDDLKA